MMELKDQRLRSRKSVFRMEFRRRDYSAEEQGHVLRRSRTDHHPLLPPSPSFHNQVVVEKNGNNDFFDPLRGLNAVDSTSAEEKASNTTTNNNSQVSSKEWTSFKRFLMQKFPVSKMISIASMPDVIIKSSTSFRKSSESSHLEEVDDPQRISQEDVKVITGQEYVSRLHELKDEINRAWHAEDRVTALKLTIKMYWTCLEIWYGNASSRKLNFQKMEPFCALYQRILKQVIFALMRKKLAITGFAKLVQFESYFHAFIWSWLYFLAGVFWLTNL